VVRADRRAARETQVKLGIKTAAMAGGVLAALFAAGCAAPSVGTVHATVQSCTAYGVHAIEHHITVTRKPAPCQGLSKAEVNQAVAMAVVRVTREAPKAIRRQREAEAAPYLAHLVSPLPPGAASPTGAQSAAATTGRDLPMAIAALIAWIVAASSGAYVLGSWLAHGGSLRRRDRGSSTGLPPGVVFGHFGLALSGLVVWVLYLISDWKALAWVAVGVLLPVAGLGMATLAIGLPGRRAATPPQGDDADSEVGAGDTGAAAGDFQIASGTSGSTRTATVDANSAGMGGTATVSVRARLSPLVVAVHGALAVTTMILVLLAALGGASG
jgi:manganese efflux pump family protein